MHEIRMEKTDDYKTKKIKRQFIKLQKQFEQMKKEIEEAQKIDGELMQQIIY